MTVLLPTHRDGAPGVATSAGNGPARPRRAAAVLATLVTAASLAGCGTLASRPASDSATSMGAQASESGVTIFGTVDMGVGAVRSSR